MLKFFLSLIFSLLLSSNGFSQEKSPQFKDYPVDNAYTGKNHKLVLDSFSKEYKTRLNDAIKSQQPSFAGHYIVTSWGCGSGGCNTGAIIDSISGHAYPFPVGLSSVYPLKKEFENDAGQEHLYKINSRLMIFAGNLDGAHDGDGSDTIEYYEFSSGKFNFIKAIPYGKKGKDE